MIRSSIRSTFLPALIVGGFCCIWALYGFYLFIGLCAFALTCRLLAPVARQRGWGAEGRLARLRRPPFEDDSRRGTLG
jgi:hypothetical protein